MRAHPLRCLVDSSQDFFVQQGMLILAFFVKVDATLRIYYLYQSDGEISMTWKKALALVLLLVILFAGVYYLYQIEHADKQNMRDLYSEVEPLQREKEALVAERNGLEVDYALQMRDVGTIQLLIQEMDEKVFSSVYPLMRDRGIVGVLGINTKQLPGLAGKLTIDQYNRLMMDGWGSCLIYEKYQNFNNWYNTIANWTEKDNLALPTAIFFPEGTYDSSYDEFMIEKGITTVILPAEDGRSTTVTPLDGELWFTGAMPWNYTGVATDTELLARTDGANLTFTMSFSNLWDAYEKEPFIRILDTWVSMLDTDDPLEELIQPTPTPNANDPDANVTPQDQLLMPRLKTTNYETAREAHLTSKENNATLMAEQIKRQEELDAQIAALDEQIREIYDRWDQSVKTVK